MATESYLSDSLTDMTADQSEEEHGQEAAVYSSLDAAPDQEGEIEEVQTMQTPGDRLDEPPQRSKSTMDRLGEQVDRLRFSSTAPPELGTHTLPQPPTHSAHNPTLVGNDKDPAANRMTVAPSPTTGNRSPACVTPTATYGSLYFLDRTPLDEVELRHTPRRRSSAGPTPLSPPNLPPLSEAQEPADDEIEMMTTTPSTMPSLTSKLTMGDYTPGDDDRGKSPSALPIPGDQIGNRPSGQEHKRTSFS
jgi:hypothetical protein